MSLFRNLSLIFCSLALLLFSCGKTEKKATAVVVEIQTVRVQTVTEREVDQTSEFTATVQAEIKNSIAPSSPGRIREILVEVGQKVVKGQKLVQMDVANLSNSETQIENLKRMYKRTQELFSVGGASQQELDNSKLQLDLALTNKKNLTENTFLLSPISGIVTARNYDNGDMYSAQQPVLTVMQINPVKLLINISESYYSQVKIGMPIDINLDVFQGEHFEGKISLIYPTIDERSRTFAAEIKLNNNNNKLRPGMFARVKIQFGTAKRVLVPDQSIVKQSGSGARYVFVYDSGKVEYIQVELGRRIENEFEILSGIKNGDQVVVSGQSRLVDGAAAKVLQ